MQELNTNPNVKFKFKKLTVVQLAKLKIIDFLKSSELEHEVLFSHKPPMSITSWLKTN